MKKFSECFTETCLQNQVFEHRVHPVLDYASLTWTFIRPVKHSHRQANLPKKTCSIMLENTEIDRKKADFIPLSN